MLKKVLIILILSSFFFACSDNKQHIKTPESDIINTLNDGDYNKALAQIDKELETDPDNQELLYLKVQAISGQAGVDVYSLFPIIKMKLFDVAMTEWSSLNKYSKLKQKQLGGTSNLDKNETADKFLKKREELKTLSPKDLIYTVVSFAPPSWRSDSDNSPYCDIHFIFETSMIDKIPTQYQEYLYVNSTCSEFKIENHKEKIDRIVRAKLLEEIDRRIYEYNESKKTEKTFKLLYALFESISTIKASPTLLETMQPNVYEALGLLKELLKNNDPKTRIGQNARKQMGLLAGFLIITAIKRSVDLNKAQEPADIICHTDPQKVVKNYSVARTGFRYLITSLSDSEFAKKNESSFMDFKQQIEDMPEEMDMETQAEFIQNINEDKINCPDSVSNE